MSEIDHKENTSGAFEADKNAAKAEMNQSEPEANSAPEANELDSPATEMVTEEPATEATPEAAAVTVTAEESIEPGSPATEMVTEEPATEAAELIETEKLPMAAEAEKVKAVEGIVVEEHEEEHEEHAEEEHDEAAFANLDIEQLVSLFVETSKVDNLTEIRGKMSVLRGMIEHHFQAERQEKLTAFLEAGNKDEDFAPNANPLHLLFLDANAKYMQRRQKDKESREQALVQNFNQKEKLLVQLQQLIEEEETKGITNIDALRQVQAQWKEIGPVTPAQRNEQWQRYHFLIDKFYDNLRINRELKELDLQKNLEGKIELCEKAEELLLEQSIKKAVEALNVLHEHWKQLGPVPREQKETVWERFKAASDKIYEKRKLYFNSLDAERAGNLERKEALCSELETLLQEVPKDHQSWVKQSEAVEKLQANWKSIGFAPKAQNTAIWRRFKQATDQFYTSKNLFYKSVRSEQLENLQAKEALCVQAEALMNSEDWKGTTDAIIHLQKEWKKVGAVNRKASDKIWNRFRAACDHFFERKNQHFSGQDARQEDNLKAKIELIEQIEQFIASGDQRADLEQLKAFQRSWTEIGFIPIKHKADVNERYRKALNNHFDALKLSQTEKTRMNFQNKVENLKTGKDGDKALRKEQFQIQNRISALKNDILLWENNMGFFAASKNADLLKQEIEQKIAKARLELEQLHQKLLVLRDA